MSHFCWALDKDEDEDEDDVGLRQKECDGNTHTAYIERKIAQEAGEILIVWLSQSLESSFAGWLSM